MKRLLLLGGGHAHALVLRRFIRAHLTGPKVVLVTPSPIHTYSGMVPGVVAGHYAAAQAQIDLARLARDAGAELRLDTVVSLDAEERRVSLASGATLSYDLASLNLGSLPEYAGVLGAARHAIAAKPFDALLSRWQELKSTPAPRIAIAGAGAAGVELAMAMAFARNARVALFSDRIAFSGRLLERIRRALNGFSIDLRLNNPVAGVEPGPTVVSPSGRERFDALFWVTGAAALPLLKESGLACDARGYVCVDAKLRSVSHPEVLAAGDAASFEGGPLPKSGVVSVRQGAVLARNLASILQGKALCDYEPQANSLALISCGGRYAIASRGGWSAEGAWAWYWKDWIDRRWIARFR